MQPEPQGVVGIAHSYDVSSVTAVELLAFSSEDPELVVLVVVQGLVVVPVVVNNVVVCAIVAAVVVDELVSSAALMPSSSATTTIVLKYITKNNGSKTKSKSCNGSFRFRGKCVNKWHQRADQDNCSSVNMGKKSAVY